MRAADPAVKLRAQAHSEKAHAAKAHTELKSSSTGTPAVKLRAKAHDELKSQDRPSTGTDTARISGQQEDEESKDKRSRQPLRREVSSRKERKKPRRAPDPVVSLRAKADAAHDGTRSNSAAGEVDRGGLGGAQRHQDVQGGRRDGEQHLAQKRSRG